VVKNRAEVAHAINKNNTHTHTHTHTHDVGLLLCTHDKNNFPVWHQTHRIEIALKVIDLATSWTRQVGHVAARHGAASDARIAVHRTALRGCATHAHTVISSLSHNVPRIATQHFGVQHMKNEPCAVGRRAGLRRLGHLRVLADRRLQSVVNVSDGRS
jgi:hypothetical protein